MNQAWVFSGERMAELRMKADMTQAELVAALGWQPEQQGNLSRWEVGTGIPSVAALKSLALALKPRLPDVIMDDFMVYVELPEGMRPATFKVKAKAQGRARASRGGPERVAVQIQAPTPHRFSGDQLLTHRIKANMTQAELSKAMQWQADQQGNISRWEVNEGCPRVAGLKSIVEALKKRPSFKDLTMDDFMVPGAGDDEE